MRGSHRICILKHLSLLKKSPCIDSIELSIYGVFLITLTDYAEDVLQKLGIPVSVVINFLYRQIIYRQGVPFSLTILKAPRTLDSMSNAELDVKLQHSYEQSLAGEGKPFAQVFDELERGIG